MKNRKLSLKKTLAFCVALIMALICLSACGGNSESGSASSSSAASQSKASDAGNGEAESGQPSPADSKVVVGLAHDPQNIGPFQGMSAGRIGILYTVYEFLVTTKGGEMTGVLMKDYEKIDDLTYNVEIYDYIYDHDKNHVTAADVAFSYNSGMDSGNLPKLGSIDSVEVVSEYVVQFKFNKLAIGDLGALWMECPIVTKAAYDASPDQMATKPVSTTAYRCTEFVSGSRMIFENTGSYWQTDASKISNCSKANVNTIVFDIITDASQLTNALKTRSIDVTNWLSDSDVEDFENAEGFGLSPIPDNTTYFLLFNCDEETGVFAGNPELRQALAYAINKDQLVQGALSSNGKTAKTWGNTNYSDFQDKWLNEDYYETDIEKAKQLLKDAGGEGLSVKLMLESGDTNTKIATIIQAQLGQIGVNVELATYDAQLANDYKYQPGEWDIMLDQGGSTSYLVNVWKLNWDAAGYTHGGAENFVKDNKLQELLGEAMDIDGHSDESIDAFHQYLKEQCYGIGLVQPMSNITHTSNISEIVVDARGQVTPGACAYNFS